MTAACFDAEGKISDYLTLTDKVYEPGDGSEVRTAPTGYYAVRPLALETPPCDHAEIYVYVIANTFPASDVIAKSPPFEIELATSIDGAKPESHLYKVNQWGGLTVKQSLA
jgi:hypothetical protein